MNTEELIKRCIDRDHTAWDIFVKRYKGLIIRSVRYKLKKNNADMPYDEYRDIVQEIFLEIWEKNRLSRINDISSLEKWLIMYSLNRTSNYWRDHLRRSKATVSLDKDISGSQPEFTLASILPCNKHRGDKAAEYGDIREILEKEFEKLNDRQKVVLKLNLYHRKKQKDIASIMNIPQNTVSTLIRRAKNQVREGVGKYLEQGAKT